MSRRDALIVRAFCVWTLYVWVTRLWNIWRDDHGVAFKAVHSVLALVSVVLAAAVWQVVNRNRARARAAA